MVVMAMVRQRSHEELRYAIEGENVNVGSLLGVAESDCHPEQALFVQRGIWGRLSLRRVSFTFLANLRDLRG